LKKKRILIAHPFLSAIGGGSTVAAWAVEALRDVYDISFATLRPPDCAAINRSFGTSLRDTDFTVHLPPPSYDLLLRTIPIPGALLEQCLTMRWAQNVDRREHFDILLGTQNEIDFGRRGIQYVHHPWVFLPRPYFEMRWYHHIPGMLPGYRAMCMRIARASNAGLRQNLSLVNSSFIADRMRQAHGVESAILYPPVPGGFPEVAWETRRQGFVALGRIHEHKRWDMAIAIIEEVRRRGHDVTFTLIGSRNSKRCYAQMVELSSTRPWFHMLNDLSREELVAEVAHHRYGIHTMEDEHFGIGPAEMQRAGCMVFVHNSGGTPEIVGGDSRLLFDNVQEGADKIERVFTDPVCEEDLRRHVAAQRGRFSAETFCASLREIVAGFHAGLQE
jgi:glycosyltransferase involved in cell wall biosynthesis